MKSNLKEGDHHGGNQPDVDHLGVRCRWQGLSLPYETDKDKMWTKNFLKFCYNSHGGQDKEHGEVDLDHHINVLFEPGVG